MSERLKWFHPNSWDDSRIVVAWRIETPCRLSPRSSETEPPDSSNFNHPIARSPGPCMRCNMAIWGLFLDKIVVLTRASVKPCYRRIGKPMRSSLQASMGASALGVSRTGEDDSGRPDRQKTHLGRRTGRMGPGLCSRAECRGKGSVKLSLKCLARLFGVCSSCLLIRGAITRDTSRVAQPRTRELRR